MKSPIEIYASLDTETTGLKSRHHYYTKKGQKEETCGNAGMIEIAICPISADLQDLPEYSSGIIALADDREINQGALDANGITREQIKNGRDPKEVAKELKDYFKKLHKTASKIIICGHNLDFDIPFITDFLEEQGIDLSKLVSDKHTFDTMWRSREVWIESENYKLGTCCKNAGVTLVDAHRALADTRATKGLVKYILQNSRGEGSSASAETKEEEVRHRVTFEM